jgi:hypothetical protein
MKRRSFTHWTGVLIVAATLTGCATAPPQAVAVSPSLTLDQQIAACGTIDDKTKDRLDCFDGIPVPTPAPPGPAIVIVKCHAVVEQDARLLCFDKLLIVQTAPPKVVVHPRPIKHYVRRGRRGCGSRGGPGYRLPNGKCASWRDRR